MHCRPHLECLLTANNLNLFWDSARAVPLLIPLEQA